MLIIRDFNKKKAILKGNFKCVSTGHALHKKECFNLFTKQYKYS